MNLQIKRIDPESLALITGVLTLSFSLAQTAKELISPPPGEPKQAMATLLAIALTTALGAVHGLIIALVYNLYTKLFRGVTIETTPLPPLPNQSLE